MDPIAIIDYSSLSPVGFNSGKDDRALVKAYLNLKACCRLHEVAGSLEWITPLANDLDAQVQTVAKDYRMLDRSVLVSIAAARQLKKKLPHERVAINIGCSRGATDLWETMHSSYITGKALPPYSSPLTTLGNISSWVAQDLSLDAVALSHSVTCSSAAHALANACAWINSGMAEFFIAGGAECSLTGFTIAQMRALRIYADPNLATDFACKPLAAERVSGEGMVLGEGASLFLLSKAKNSSALAYISGIGCAQEQVNSATAIDEEGAGFEQAMKRALQDSPGDIDAVIMHAPGTKKGDLSEYRAIERVFTAQFPLICSNKWLYGHTFAAAAAFNLELAIALIQGQIKELSFPYATFIDQRYKSMPKRFNRIMINAAGFGGNVVSIIISVSDKK